MRTTKMICCSLPMDLYDQLESACKRNRMRRSVMVQMALRTMFEKGQAVVQLPDYDPTDDDGVSKTGERRKRASRS